MTQELLLPTLISLVFTVIYGSVFIYLPGLLIYSNTKANQLEKLSTSLVTGISLYGLLVYSVRFFSLPFFASELILLGFILINKKKLKLFSKSNFNKLPKTFLIIAILTALIHSAVLFTSYLPSSAGILFTNLSFHDSTQHLTIIKRLYELSSPLHPGFSGASLVNYHYLIDQIVSSFTRFSFISLEHTYYRTYPLLISLIFSLSIYTFTRSYSKQKHLPIFTLLFTLFAGNASYFYQFIRGSEFSWGSNTFIINPLIDLLQNPASIFVLAQLLTVTTIIKTYDRKSTNLQPGKIIALGIISGTMIGFKAWGGLLIFTGLATASIWQILKHKSFSILIATILFAAISSWIFLPHYDPSTSASPVWAPGWTLDHLINDQDRWNQLEDIFLMEHYQSKQNLPRLIQLYSKWTFLYIFGNYWLRLIGLIVISTWLIKLTKLTSSQVLIITVSFFSLIIPLFFNQGRMAYDIEQFSPYALLFASIFTILTVSKIFNKLKLSPFIPLSLMSIILLSAPSNLTSLKARIFNDKKLITTQELEAFNQAQMLSEANAVFILSPSHRNISTLEFAALTNRNTYYSGRTLSIITGEDYQTRQDELSNTFSHPNSSTIQKYFSDNHITHAFLYQEDLQNYPDLHLENWLIFQNQAASIYQFID